MWQGMRRWFTHLPFADSVEQRQALLVQIFLSAVFIGPVVWLGLILILLETPDQRLFPLTAGACCAIGALGGMVFLRRGRMKHAARSAITGYLLGMLVLGLGFDISTSQILYVGAFIPLILASLFLSRREILATLGVLLMVLLVSEVRPYSAVPFPPEQVPATSIAAVFLIGLAVSIFLSYFSHFLRAAINQASTREQELQQLQTTLEQAVAQRTRDIQKALQEIQTQFDTQQQLLAENTQQRELIRVLSVPVLPIGDDILVMPLIGLVDAERSAPIMESLLSAIEHYRARWVVIDMTGVPAG